MRNATQLSPNQMRDGKIKICINDFKTINKTEK